MIYAWPASAITVDDMAVLHQVRQHSHPRTPINELIAGAVRRTYGASPSGVPHEDNKLTPGAPCDPDHDEEAT